MLNRLLSYFSRFFAYSKKIDNSDVVNQVEEEHSVVTEEQDVKHDDIVNLTELNTNDKNGQIYWVHMNEDYITDKTMEESHKIRPFLIVDSDSTDYTGYYMTSNLKNFHFNKPWFSKYKSVISNNRYNLKKPSIVLLGNTVTVSDDEVLNYIDTLGESDYIRVLKNAGLYAKRKVNISGMYIDIGDVIDVEDRKYFIYQKDNTYLYGFLIKNKGLVWKSNVDFDNDFNYFRSGNDLYRVFYDSNIKVPVKDNYLVTDVMNEDVHDQVITKRKNMKYKQKVKRRK
ncbi:MAG: hypothetical protein E7160_03400 [Firmicutes bacterium]|nr:hypothetical protein [Bacillota bacterium]